jgi:hypothetical protein
MFDALIRKTRQLAQDPVLRHWLLLRALRRTSAAPAFRPHCPPYLDDLGALALLKATDSPFEEIPDTSPSAPIDIPLPGQTISLNPGEEETLFQTSFDDTETLLAAHRFAWLPLIAKNVDPAWVQALWRAWLKRHGTPDESWAWHPYTAAERAINIITYAKLYRLPGPLEDTLACLCAHGPAILEKLEYFGDHHTSNHLSNNGRGLYLLGLALGIEPLVERGRLILLEEARRIFAPSGILREGSSHYHLLLTRNYAEAWLAARNHNRPEAADFQDILARALAVIPHLALSNALPLIGDVSPDCPPDFLMGLAPNGGTPEGWTELLPETDRKALFDLQRTSGAVDKDLLSADGWLRFDHNAWSGLWHTAPDGWSHMPGHGHQDCGGFELHFAGEPLFRDMGRGLYGETHAATYDRSALAHNTLLLDGADPYPANKPYYDNAFRGKIGGKAPELYCQENSVFLRHWGFCRLSGGGGAITRNWRFTDSAFTLSDDIEGRGQRAITRRLHTTMAVEKTADGCTLKGQKRQFRLTCDDPVSLSPATFWPAYGSATSATAIDITSTRHIPSTVDLCVEVIS